MAGLLVGASCSSSSDSDTSTGDSSSETAVNDGSPVVIGGAGTLLGFTGADGGVKARIDRANKEGGVHGRQIEFVGFTDDGSDPAANSTAIRELVQQTKVDAIVPVIPTNFQPQTAQFLDEQNIPFIGLGYTPSMCEIEAGFPFSGCSAPGVSTAGQAYLAQFIHKTIGAESLDGVTVAVFGSAEAHGQQNLDSMVKALEEGGADVVLKQGGVAAGATSVQPYVDQVMSAAPQITVLSLDFVAVLSMQSSLKASGYKGAMVNFSGFVPGTLELSEDLQRGLDGSFVVTAIPTPVDGTPLAAELTADFEAAGVPPTFGALVGWQSADMFIQLLDAAGGDPSRMVSVGNDGFTFTQAEGGFNTSFPEGHTSSSGCSGMVTVSGKEYLPVAPFTCTNP